MAPYNAALLPTAIYFGDTATVWNAETPAVGTKSISVAVGESPDSVVKKLGVELKFSADPGNFEVDIQNSDTDTENAYSSILNAAITQANLTTSKLFARFDLSPFVGNFVRLIMKTAMTNGGVTVIGKITR